MAEPLPRVVGEFATYPNGGSHLSVTANSETSRRPTQNDGIAMAMLVPTSELRSKSPPGRRPPRIPTSSAIGSASRSATSASENVMGSRSPMSSVMGWPL